MSSNNELPGAPDLAYRDGALMLEQVPVARLAESVGTLFYAYSSAYLERRYRAFTAAFGGKALLCFAVKANSNLGVLRHLGRLGAGADLVSEGELRRALAAGIPASRLIFSGIGKTEAELRAALAADVHQINVELAPELSLLSDVASRLGKTARIAIRVNPDVDANTHAKISTGKSENKFGIDLAHARDAFRRARQLPASSRSASRSISVRRSPAWRRSRRRFRAWSICSSRFGAKAWRCAGSISAAASAFAIGMRRRLRSMTMPRW